MLAQLGRYFAPLICQIIARRTFDDTHSERMTVARMSAKITDT